MINKTIKEQLREVYILEEDIAELEREHKCLFDNDNAKLICNIFIDNNIPFKCLYKVGLYEIEIIM